jgi:hypothetical protein
MPCNGVLIFLRWFAIPYAQKREKTGANMDAITGIK